MTNLQTAIKEKIKIMVISTIKGKFLTRYTEIKVIFFHPATIQPH